MVSLNGALMHKDKLLCLRKLVSSISLNGNHPNCSNFIDSFKTVKNAFIIPVIWIHWRNTTSKCCTSSIVRRIIHVFIFIPYIL